MKSLRELLNPTAKTKPTTRTAVDLARELQAELQKRPKNRVPIRVAMLISMASRLDDAGRAERFEQALEILREVPA